MRVQVWTDGSGVSKGCVGYAAILVFGRIHIYASGADAEGTNNTAELSAGILGLNLLNPEPCLQHGLDVYSDSQYTIASAEGRTNPQKNQHLVQCLHTLTFERNAQWFHVRGHSGIELNEKADELAKQARHHLMSIDPDQRPAQKLVKIDMVDTETGNVLLSKEQGIRRWHDVVLLL